MRTRKSTALLGALLVVAGGLGISACAGSDGQAMDLGGVSVLPDFVQAAPDSMQEAYLFAASHPEDLSHQPCYCGCGQMKQHESNLSCFISDIAEDGAITFDSHAMGCGICIDTARDTMRMTADGRSPVEIRQFIDARYGSFGPATPTPMPTG
jgi:hypothetical protein